MAWKTLRKRMTFEISPHEVKLDGQTIYRPAHFSPSQWLAYWEQLDKRQKGEE